MNEAKEIPTTSAEQIIASRQLELNQARERIAELEAEKDMWHIRAENSSLEIKDAMARIAGLGATINALEHGLRPELFKNAEMHKAAMEMLGVSAGDVSE
jgi:chromosome segregation ATPase